MVKQNKKIQWLSEQPKLTGWIGSLIRWVDNDAIEIEVSGNLNDQKIDWLRTVPFVIMHLGCLLVFWVGVSPVAIAVAVGLFFIRMFAITGFYHRYFSHKAFRTSRPVQFLFALIGACSVQRGPVWWAAHHRHHHVYSDQEPDVHSPVQRGFIWSHMGWFLCRVNFKTRSELVKDWLKFPELAFLDRFDSLVPTLFAISLYCLGAFLASYHPGLGTDGMQMLVWGFFISTVVLYHSTFTVNSLAHVWGNRRYKTQDDSRNNLFLALLTLGEGWHNNHHHYPGSARQGFYWWEIDITYYILILMAKLGLIWDVRPLPTVHRESKKI